MYNLPSLKRRQAKPEELNLVPILDAIFILIFFLLMSAQFVKLYEVGSELPIRSESTIDDDKKEALNLLVKVDQTSLKIFTGKKEKLKKTFSRNGRKKLNFAEIRTFLIKLKNDYPKENSVTLEPDSLISYQEIIKIIDQFKSYKDDETGDKKTLFKEIVFGNLEG